MTPSTSIAIAEGLTEVFEWRTLAEPVYGIHETYGIARRLEAGTPVRVSIPREIDSETGIGVKLVQDPGTVLIAYHDLVADVIYGGWWVTASALRFEDGLPCVCRAPGCELRDDDGATAEVEM